MGQLVVLTAVGGGQRTAQSKKILLDDLCGGTSGHPGTARGDRGIAFRTLRCINKGVNSRAGVSERPAPFSSMRYACARWCTAPAKSPVAWQKSPFLDSSRARLMLGVTSTSFNWSRTSCLDGQNHME